MRKKKDELIPYEKATRVIYVSERGRRDPFSVISLLWFILAAACFAYCGIMGLVVNFNTYFFLIWGAGGLFATIMGIIWYKKRIVSFIPTVIKVIFRIILALGVLALGFFIACDLMFFNYKPVADADYYLVFGSQVNEYGPSPTLKLRLDKTLQCLQENENAKIIVSGCQMGNEPWSEARGMADYLIAAGIDEERIILEEKARNSKENISFGIELMEEKASKVCLITNDFHMFRVTLLAKSQGIENFDTVSAGSYYVSLPNSMLREFMSTVKNIMIGNIEMSAFF